MTLEVGFKEVIALASLIVTLVGLFGKVLLSQFEKRLEERDRANRELGDARLRGIEDRQATENMRLSNLIRDVHDLMNQLPLRFVQRDDWIRFASQIDHKIDRLGELFNRYMLTGKHRDD